jgi:hypothetical protein
MRSMIRCGISGTPSKTRAPISRTGGASPAIEAAAGARRIAALAASKTTGPLRRSDIITGKFAPTGLEIKLNEVSCVAETES